jgi:hypothetical protein
VELEKLVAGIRPVTKYGCFVVGFRKTETGALLAADSRCTAVACRFSAVAFGAHASAVSARRSAAARFILNELRILGARWLGSIG